MNQPPPIPRAPSSRGGLARVLRSIGKLLLAMVLAFVCFLGFRIYQLVHYSKQHPHVATPAESAFKAAESSIMSARDGTYHGNTEQAKEAARKFSEAMFALRKTFFTEREGAGGSASLSKGNFLTYCNFTNGRCVFLVHAPDLRHFTGDAQQSLVKLAWTAAWEITGRENLPVTNLAVGVKGVLLYAGIITGTMDRTKEPKDGIGSQTFSLGSESILHPYFDGTAPLTAAPAAE